MTGIERLREFVAGISPITVVCGVTRTSYDREHMEVAGKRLRDFLADIANQIEREQGERVSRVRILAVVKKMELHCLGVEGMEDSPVARWARELREALGAAASRRESDGVADSPYDALRPDDREAVAWVREHGGLDYVMHEWQSRVPRDRYERRRQRLLDHIAECETALGRRNERIAEMEQRIKGLETENAELRKRAMPEGMEWPKYDTGEMVDFGDEVDRGDGVGASVDKVSFYGDQWRLYDRYGCEINEDMMGPGERVNRPAPKVLDADGAEVREKCDVWWICEGDERGVHAERLRVETICPNGLIECSPYNGGTWVYLEPSELYVNKPVPSSDGRPLREGETVWFTTSGREMRIDKIEHRPEGFWALELFADGRKRNSAPVSVLTHERPDSWERLEEDAGKNPFDYCKDVGHRLDTCENSEAYKAIDLVRRARALAERERGE